MRRDLDAGLERNVSFEDEDYINSVCSDVAEWLSAAANTDGAERVVERGPLAFSYALHLELRDVVYLRSLMIFSRGFYMYFWRHTSELWYVSG